MKKEVILVKLNKDPVHKFAVFIDKKMIKFGRKPYQDFTIHKNPTRMNLYLRRHSGMGEDWTITGLKTKGFWSRWLLWSKPDLQEAIKFMEKKFNLDIKYIDDL
jgi:hypothetical protein